MSYTNIPVSLVTLQTKVYSADSSNAQSSLDETSFDDQTDFALDIEQPTLAVLLNISNRRTLFNVAASGIRRKIEITLFDTSTSNSIYFSTTLINMKRGEKTHVVRHDIPLYNISIVNAHAYKLRVRDYKSGIVLGERIMHFAIKHTPEQLDAILRKSAQEIEDDEKFNKWLDEFISKNIDPEEDAYVDNDIWNCDDDDDDDDCQPSADDTDTAPQATDDDAEPTDISLNNLVGLESVKAKLASYKCVVKFNQFRNNFNLASTTQPLHAMFLGSPGTGKTTVAKMIGQMLHEAGVLSIGHVVERQRSTLLGPNYSMEETNTLDAIKEAQGGILFIDEAYQLYQPADPRDPGRFVIESLITALADEQQRDWMLILAGYPDEMQKMFDMNPGLRSRIPDSNIYIFNDYTEQELMEIADNYLSRNNYRLSDEAHQALARRISIDYKQRDKKFGNARYIINMIQTEILPAMAQRVVAENRVDRESLSVIQAIDIPISKTPANTQRQRIGFVI